MIGGSNQRKLKGASRPVATDPDADGRDRNPPGCLAPRWSMVRPSFGSCPQQMIGSTSRMQGKEASEQETKANLTWESMSAKTRGRDVPHRRRNRAVIAAAGRGERRNAFRTRARYSAPTTSQILGASRGGEHGAALARSGQAGRGPRPS